MRPKTFVIHVCSTPTRTRSKMDFIQSAERCRRSTALRHLWSSSLWVGQLRMKQRYCSIASSYLLSF